jgi:hypothetical protein
VKRTIIVSVIVGLFVFVGFGWLAWASWRDHVDAAAYSQIGRGDSQQHVIGLLGQPRRISGRPDNIAWDSEASIHANHGECVREFWYAPRLTISGDMWTIGFDDHDRVVSKYTYRSP